MPVIFLTMLNALFLTGAYLTWNGLTLPLTFATLLLTTLTFVVVTIIYNRLRANAALNETTFELDAETIRKRNGLTTQTDPGKLLQEIDTLHDRVTELKMLGQYSEALSFTINFQAILTLIYTNCQDVLNSRDFYIYLPDVHTDQIYTAFCVEDGVRQREKESPRNIIQNGRVSVVIEMGQVHEHLDTHGRFWLTAPLNAGADTAGALQASHKELNTRFTEEQKELFASLGTRTATAIEKWKTNQQLQLRAQQLETLNDVIRFINSEQDVDRLLNLILEKAIELLNVEAGSLMLRNQDTGELEFVVVHGPTSKELVGTRLPLGKGVAGKVAQTGKPIRVNNVADDSYWFSGVDDDTQFHTRSILTVPLVRQQIVIGVLQVINRRNGAPFVKTDEILLTAFAGEAAVTLENARLLQQTDAELQERVRELSLLQSLDRDLNRTLDIQQSLTLTLNWMMRLFDATAGSIVVFNEDGSVLSHRNQGYDNPNLPQAYDYTQNNFPGIIGQVLQTGKPHLAEDVTAVEGYLPSALNTQTQMTIPIINERRLLGAATIERNTAHAYDEKDLDAAVRFIEHITVAITNALLYAEVKVANEAKSEFVSLVSHELKTPLTAIRGYTDLMLTGLTGAVNEQQQEYMGTIVSNVNRMMTLIQDLTDISRIETSQLTVRLQPIPFANVVSETVAGIQSMAKNKNIDIDLHMPSDIPLVLGDHNRLVQVMTNLVGNACKYSPPDTKVDVMVRCGQNDKGQAVVWCEVRDHGYGIAPEDQQKLFSKFFRSADPNIRQSSGTGLGLFITKGLIELHGGELQFESELNKGTSFTFSVIEAQS
ncbi:MAG: GAF domain-containing protein [Anaerolineales bacterium]|nr:GAF domain-containing protein [Anaerolineales bacterium]